MIKRIDNSKNVRFGFSKRDEWYLRHHDNAASNPRVQIFTEDLDNEPEEEMRYFCAICKSRLERMPKLEMWQCSQCLETYDTTYLQDKPLKDTTGFRLDIHQDLKHYATIDEDDPNLPFVQGIDPNREPEEDKGYEVTYQSGDERIEHRSVKDMSKLTEALKF